MTKTARPRQLSRWARRRPVPAILALAGSAALIAFEWVILLRLAALLAVIMFMLMMVKMAITTR